MTDVPPWLISETIEIMGIRRKLHGHAGDPDFARIAIHPPPFAPLIQEVCAQKTGFVFLDCGACLGYGSLIASAAGAHLVSIEADPRAATCLRHTYAENGLPVPVIEAIVGAGGADLKFSVERRLAAGSVSADGALRVRQVTIDEVVQAQNLHAVDLICLDVNGFEFEALRGAQDVLMRMRPKVLMRYDPIALAVSGRVSPVTVLDWLIERFGAFVIVDGEGHPAEMGASVEAFVRKSVAQPPVWLQFSA